MRFGFREWSPSKGQLALYAEVTNVRTFEEYRVEAEHEGEAAIVIVDTDSFRESDAEIKDSFKALEALAGINGVCSPIRRALEELALNIFEAGMQAKSPGAKEGTPPSQLANTGPSPSLKLR